jgi:carbamate kinase
MNKLAVIALGGNALLRGNQLGTIEEQEENATETFENLVYLFKEGYNVIFAHGNGPQVGNILLRNDAGEQLYGIPQMPLDICVADSQGGIGFMLERCLLNVLRKHKINRPIVTLVTQVMVDKNDEAFQNPTKRIGKIYTKIEADKLAAEKGWVFKEEVKTNGGWRRVVPSPKPLDFFNSETVEQMAREGNIVITVGGGGVPVYIDEENRIRPLDAVIDKDLAAAMVAKKVKADEYFILTDVPFVYLNYKKENEEVLEFLNFADTQKYLDQGVFSEGSMAPKIKACLDFLKHGGKKAVITESKKLQDKSYGTKITMEYDPNDKKHDYSKSSPRN